MHDFIFVSLEDWDQIWRRNQFICDKLMRRHLGMKILFVGLPRDASRDLRRGRLRGVVRALTRLGTYTAAEVAGGGRVTVTHPLKLVPDSLPGGRAFNAWLFRRHVRRTARAMNIRRPVLWINAHAAGHLTDSVDAAAVVYDVTDDWSVMSQSPAAAARVRRQDALLCDKADAVIVCSQRLLELKRPMNPHVHLIANGVDANHYAGVSEGPGTLSAEWRRPILGYVGTVHSDRVDVELVRAVAQCWRGSIVLVGPDFLGPADTIRLALPNVHRVGSIAYSDVPKYMAAFDICVVPHRMTSFTESLNPIKLWEYLAGGKPIVSTDVAGFRDYPSLVRLARSAEEFAAMCDAALAEAGTSKGAGLIAKRQAVARANAWGQRVNEIERVIEACLERRSANEPTTG